jgi:hypothetical protein
MLFFDTTLLIELSIVEDENEDMNGRSAAAAVAAKRKGSFKKWLRSSHRKFTSTSNSRLLKDASNTATASNTNGPNGAQKYSDLDNMKIKVCTQKKFNNKCIITFCKLNFILFRKY